MDQQLPASSDFVGIQRAAALESSCAPTAIEVNHREERGIVDPRGIYESQAPFAKSGLELDL